MNKYICHLRLRRLGSPHSVSVRGMCVLKKRDFLRKGEKERKRERERERERERDVLLKSISD